MSSSAKKIEERNKTFMNWYGFNEDTGYGYVILGDTYTIKDNLKKWGAKWNAVISSWVIDHNIPIDDCKLVKINVFDIYGINTKYGTLDKYASTPTIQDNITDILYMSKEYLAEIKRIKYEQIAAEAKLKGLGFVGNVGEKVFAVAKLEEVKSYPNYFGYYNSETFKYKFITEDGNSLIWSTASYLPEEAYEDNVYLALRGTVKEHKEIKGIPTTIVTRCKVELI